MLAISRIRVKSCLLLGNGTPMRKFSSFITETTTLHHSLESSTKMLLANQHENVVTCFKSRGDRSMDELHPLEKNVYALGLLFTGEKEQALNVQSQTVKNFTQSLGSTSDSFLDVAGSINDLAVIHISSQDYLNAEKQLKRALLMVERSYRVDNHLRSTLLANLSNVYRLTSNKELCLKIVDQLLPHLNAKQQNKKLDAIDIATLNPAEGEDSLNEFWRSLTEAKRLETDKIESRNQENAKTRDKFYYTRQIFSSVRSIQFSLHAGHCIGTNRLHEEGLIYVNKAFGSILMNNVGPQQEGDLSTWDTFLLSSALSKLSDLSEDSFKTRGRGLSSKHIENDNVSVLFKLPYFKNKFPSVSDLDLSLASPFRDLKNAATQIYKSRVSPPKSGDDSRVIASFSEYEMLSLAGSGIVGVALLDIEHHCPPPLQAASDIPAVM